MSGPAPYDACSDPRRLTRLWWEAPTTRRSPGSGARASRRDVDQLHRVLVGAAGFEPATSGSRNRPATAAAYPGEDARRALLRWWWLLGHGGSSGLGGVGPRRSWIAGRTTPGWPSFSCRYVRSTFHPRSVTPWSSEHRERPSSGQARRPCPRLPRSAMPRPCDTRHLAWL